MALFSKVNEKALNFVEKLTRNKDYWKRTSNEVTPVFTAPTQLGPTYQGEKAFKSHSREVCVTRGCLDPRLANLCKYPKLHSSIPNSATRSLEQIVSA